MTALSQFGTRARRVTAPREAAAERSTQADAAAQGVFWIAAALLGVGSVALLLNAYAIAPSHLDALLPLGMFYLAIAVSESIRNLLRRARQSAAAGPAIETRAAGNEPTRLKT